MLGVGEQQPGGLIGDGRQRPRGQRRVEPGVGPEQEEEVGKAGDRGAVVGLRAAVVTSAAWIAAPSSVPEERLSDAVAALVRATLGPPVRDLATTRQGAVGYALLKLAPRRLIDRIAHRRMRASARQGHMDGSELAAGLRQRLLRSG